MYATPQIRETSLDAESSSCCDFYLNGNEIVRNPGCESPLLSPFPTCGPTVQGLLAPLGLSVCAISVATPVGTLTISG